MNPRTSLIYLLLIASAFAGARLLSVHIAVADEAADKSTDKSTDKPQDKPATSQPAAEAEATGTAAVKTAAIRFGEISQSITAFGSVTAQPGATNVFSVQFECRVKHILVSAGQQIDKDTPLIEVEPSPDVKLQLLEATNAVESSNKDLEQTQQRFNMKLATNTELLTSQQAVQVAKTRLESLKQRGAAEDSRKISADGLGLVSKVDVQEGQIVPAGGPLMETMPHTSIEVRLGVEPSEIARIKPDQSVELFPLSAGGEEDADESIDAKIRLITRRVNPDTRLVDVFVTPDSPEGLLLDSSLRATLTAEKRQGLVVPREALLPDDEDLVMFTVKDGKAVKHVVKSGLKNDTEVEIIGEGLKAGDPVVVLGNLELEDGMTVTIGGGEVSKQTPRTSLWQTHFSGSVQPTRETPEAW